MKSFLAIILAICATTFVACAEDVTATITGVHLCCEKCLQGVDAVVSKIDTATVKADKEAKTITITAPDRKTAQKVASALVHAGYFGQSKDVKMNNRTGATGETVTSLKIKDVHLCCPKCVRAAEAAIKPVPGVTGDTCAPHAATFEVTGNFVDKDVFAALEKAGFAGKIAK